jgi:hypothetical protein
MTPDNVVHPLVWTGELILWWLVEQAGLKTLEVLLLSAETVRL